MQEFDEIQQIKEILDNLNTKLDDIKKQLNTIEGAILRLKIELIKRCR